MLKLPVWLAQKFFNSLFGFDNFCFLRNQLYFIRYSLPVPVFKISIGPEIFFPKYCRMVTLFVSSKNTGSLFSQLHQPDIAHFSCYQIPVLQENFLLDVTVLLPIRSITTSVKILVLKKEDIYSAGWNLGILATIELAPCLH